MKSGGLRDTWQDFGTPTKVLFVGMFLSGLVLLAVSVAADIQHAGWMADHAFIPNVLAGFSSFLVGVPVALVGLGTITSQRQEKAETDRVEALSEIAWLRFRDSVYEFCDDIPKKSKMNRLYELSTQIQKQHDVILDGFRTEDSRLKRPRDADPFVVDDYQETLGKFLKEQSDIWVELFHELLSEVGFFDVMTLSWLGIVRDWTTLDQFVRLQRLERELDWFDREYDSYFLEIMRMESNPLADFFALHGDSRSMHTEEEGTMWHACMRVRSLARLRNYAQLDDEVSNGGPYFPSIEVGGYSGAYTHNAFVLSNKLGILKQSVQSIDHSGWYKAR